MAALLFAPLSASAFGGLYVSGAKGQLLNDASLVVLVRDGTHTVLSMQNRYRGPPQDFALVVPVPVVLRKDDVTTLPREALTRVDELTSPRLIELDARPCYHGSGGCSGTGVLGPQLVEARFDVEEYEIVILSAESSRGLFTWLKENKYSVPDGAAEVLEPYVAAGSKFVVAKVDAKKLQWKDGEAVLSPLRLHYDSEAFTLPVRVGLLNSAGTQDLVVHIIAKSRYEVANVKNVLVPTNFEVHTRTQDELGGFYGELVDRTFKRNPGAALTEFAWEGALPPPHAWLDGGSYAVTCGPCPPTHPVDEPLARYLGVNLLPGLKTDDDLAGFIQGAIITRLHLRYTKDSAPRDLVFKAVGPIAGGVPEVKALGPAKHNQFQGLYVVRVPACTAKGGRSGFSIDDDDLRTLRFLDGGAYVDLGAFYSSGSAVNRPPATSTRLIDPFEQLLVADLPELDVKAQPLSKSAPKLEHSPPQQLTPMPRMVPVPTPQFSLGAPQVKGGLDAESVTRVLKRNRGQFRWCWDTRRQAEPTLAGQLTVHFSINAGGAVAAATATDSTVGAELDACALERLRTFIFPAPKGGRTVDVTAPLIFELSVKDTDSPR